VKTKHRIDTSDLANKIATRLFTYNYGMGGGSEILSDRIALKGKTKSGREKNLGGRDFSNAVNHIVSELRKAGL
jgi:hypothetical protein